ncbi:hypothetical protein A2U01_0064310, partial [Trifolium medium]|nr:hypothetical protein [Trifolium medium]
VSDLSIGVPAGTTPPSGGLIAAQRRFAGHSLLLITRYDQGLKHLV